LAAEIGLRRRLWRQRRVREALLLDLGALVYDLHREGRRAPELLRAKASRLDAVDGEVRALEQTLGAEPAAGAEGAPRHGLHGGLRPALAVVAGVVVAGAIALGFALSEITSGADDGAQRAAASREPTAATPGPPGTSKRADAERAPAVPAPTATGGAPARLAPRPTARLEPRPNALLEWPKDFTGHTAVLSTTSDRAAALALARQARRTGLEAGLLRAGDYGLGDGLWIVFSGRFDSPEGAARQAAGLAERFPGAYPQRIDPVQSSQ
jgi:hypothetical protein